MGFFSRLVSSVVEKAYEVADAITDYVSEKVGRGSHPGCGSVYARDMAARERRVEHTQANRESEGFPRYGYKRSDVYDNVVELDLEAITKSVPQWAYEHKSGPRYRTGTDD